MTGIVADRVCDTTTTTGTGAITVTGTAVTGYQTLDDVLINGNTFYYLIEAVDGSGNPTADWEVGVGTVTATAPIVFTRTLIISSSNTGSAVSFAAGTKRVHLVAPAQQVGFSGGQFILSSNLTAQDFTTATAIGWTSRNFDTSISTFHDNVTNNTRITIPVDYGVCYAKFSGQIALSSITADEVVNLTIRASGIADVAHKTCQVNSTTPFFQIESKVLFVSPTEYYELKVQTAADTSVDVVAASSHFQIEILQ
jgi:hypothetical protein